MVDIEHLLNYFVIIIFYGFIGAPLLASVFDATTIPSGLTSFFVFLIIPLMGIRILYVMAKGGKKNRGGEQ